MKVREIGRNDLSVYKYFIDSNKMQRSGAGVVYLNVFHPDVQAFMDTRKENADEKVRIKTLSLGLLVPNKFYELISKDEMLYQFSPHDVKKYYDMDFDEANFDEMYDTFLNDGRIKKTKIKARDLETEISKLQQESGYPYIINIDKANEANPITHGLIKMSNLCTEIFQVQYPSLLNDEQEYVHMGTDISCNLGSTIVNNLMISEDFGKSVRTMLRALTTISDNSNISAVPTIKKGNDLFHTVGLGAMGLHTFLAKNKIHYDSEEAVEFTGIYFMLLNYWTLYESNKLAIDKGQTFYKFKDTEYADGTYFDKRYIGKDFRPRFVKVSELFKDIFIPTDEDWEELKQSIIHHGLYNQNRLAVAPNGSIGYVRETSPSIHPLVDLIEERVEGKTGSTFYPAPHLSNENLDYYKKSVYDMDMRRVIDVYAAAQYHVDQGISMNIYIREYPDDAVYEWKRNSPNKELTTRDLNILRNYAFNKNIKSIYYTRILRLDNEGNSQDFSQCESCVV